jgi:transcriptional regulator with XRE-family HTH domain
LTGLELRAFRRITGLNQKQLADLFGTSRLIMSRYETELLEIPWTIEALVHYIRANASILDGWINKQKAREQIKIRSRQHRYRTKA